MLLIQDGFTSLHKAVIGKKEAVISHLLRKGANPHVRDRVTGTIFYLIYFSVAHRFHVLTELWKVASALVRLNWFQYIGL
jgi:hypothetical protein